MDDQFLDALYTAEYFTDNFFIGKDNFEDLEIRPSPTDKNFYFFFNKRKNSLIRGGFVLKETNGIVYVCNITLIKTGTKFSPKIQFTKRDKNKKLVGSTSSISQIRSRVELEECMGEFWQLIIYLQSLSDIDVPQKPFSINPSAIEHLNIKNLGDLSSLVNVKGFKNILSNWEENKENGNEEFWQLLFQQHSWIVSQLFACPFVMIGKKFYCGGKEDDDKGGVKGDLLFKNEITGNVAFVEIKTPKTNLVSGIYRGSEGGKENVIFSIDQYVTGGVNQVINQRKVYQQNFGDNNGKYLHNAKCILIIGNSNELDKNQMKSFELYRSTLSGVEVVTYNELFKRISTLLDVFKLT